MRNGSGSDRLIVALDFTELRPAVAMARRLRGMARTVKVGSVLFTAYGPEAIRRMRALGFQVMLDLKFLDIPSTVELSCRAAVRHGVSLLTVHACGEPAMLKAAVAAVRTEARRLRRHPPRVLAVTVLTSLQGGTASAVRQRVLALAKTAARAGCDGVVASAQEAGALRRRFGRRLAIVCPGIRPARTGRGDQHRVCTPADALRSGADALVIGRPITAARQPRAAAQAILTEMEGASRC